MNPIETLIRPDGQEYKCVGSEPYTNRHGYKTELLLWHTKCRACGIPIEAKSRIGKQPETRNCPAHHGMRKKMIAALDFCGGASS